MIVVSCNDPLKLVDPVAEIAATLYKVGLKLSGPPTQTPHSGTPLSSRHARCRHELCAGHGQAARALTLVLLRLGAAEVAEAVDRFPCRCVAGGCKGAGGLCEIPMQIRKRTGAQVAQYPQYAYSYVYIRRDKNVYSYVDPMRLNARVRAGDRRAYKSDCVVRTCLHQLVRRRECYSIQLVKITQQPTHKRDIRTRTTQCTCRQQHDHCCTSIYEHQ